MSVIVIGAQASGLGKTGVICSLIAAMPERRWTAIKVTQCSHLGVGGAGSRERFASDAAAMGAKPCDCELGGAQFAVSEERVADANTDSSRYLAAGAARALWVRTLPGHLGEALPRIREAIAQTQSVIVESNSILEFVDPKLYALIVSPCVRDFKASARQHLDRADAILMAAPPPGRRVVRAAWLDDLSPQLDGIPRFALARSQPATAEFVAFVRDRAARKQMNP